MSTAFAPNRKRFLAVMVLGLFAAWAYMQWREGVRRRNLAFERVLHTSRIRTGMGTIAFGLEEVWASSQIATNRDELVKLYNQMRVDPLSTTGNPFPGLLPDAQYFWLKHWDLNTDGTNAPLLWAFAGRTGELPVALSIGGRVETLDSRLFRTKLRHYKDRIISTGPSETNAVPWWRRKVTNAENPNSVP